MVKIKRILCLVVLLTAGVNTVSSQSISSQEDLAITAKEFFSVFMLRRDVKGSIKYISSNPILGDCMIPGYLEKKKILSNKDVKSVLGKVFANLTQNSFKTDDLSKVISSRDTDVFYSGAINNVNHSLEKYFRIFTLKQQEDSAAARFVCKFDERKLFREKVSAASVYYLVTRIDLGEKSEPVILITLWVKEGKNWRILTLEPTTD